MERTIIQRAKDEKLNPFMRVLISFSMIPPNLTPGSGAEELFYKLIFNEEEVERTQEILLNELVTLVYELNSFWKKEIKKNFPSPQDELFKKIFVGLIEDINEDSAFPYYNETITLKEFADEALMEFFTVKYDPQIKRVLENLYRTDNLEEFKEHVTDIFLSLKVRSFYSETLLHVAIEYRANKIAAYLIENDFPLDVVDKFGNTPLHNAAYYGNSELFQVLIQHKAPLGTRNKSDLFPLEMLFFSENYDFFNSLLEKKFIKINNYLKENIISKAMRDDKVVILKRLIEMHEVDPYRKLARSQSIIYYAVHKRNSSVLKWLIEYQSCSVDYMVHDGYTLLNSSVFKGDMEMVTYLVDKGADVNILSRFMTSNLYYSIGIDSNNKMSQYLIDHGAKFEIDKVNIAREITVSMNIPLLKQMMLEVSNMNFLIKKRTTPFLNAIMRGNQEMIDMLIDTCDIEFHNDHKVAILVAAINSRNFELVKKLLERGANPNLFRTQKKVRTYPLFAGTTQGDLGTVRLLIQFGANPNQISFLGVTPLSYASTLKRYYMVYEYLQTVVGKPPFYHTILFRNIVLAAFSAMVMTIILILIL